MSDTPPDPHSEFRALGAAEVRRRVMMRRWPPEKLAAARAWLERRDIEAWDARRSGVSPRPRSDWRRKWLPYAVGGLGVLFMALRLLQMLKRG